MSQFQQPNQRPAPGVVDLGTGRQARMSQSNMNAGAIGSRGVTGGQSLRGTDTPVQANNVDAVSYLLGSAAEGMQGFVGNYKKVKASYEKRATDKLAGLEALRVEDENRGLSSETVTDNHLRRLQSLRMEGFIDSDLDANKTLGAEISRTHGMDDRDTASSYLKSMQEELAGAAHSLVEQKAIYDRYETKAKSQPRVLDLMKDRIATGRNSVAAAKANRDYAHEKLQAKDALDAKHLNLLESPAQVLDFMNSRVPPIALGDEDRLERLTEEYYKEFYPTIMQEQDPEARARLEEEHFDLIAPLVQKDIARARQQIETNDRTVEREQSTFELTQAMESDYSALPVDPAQLVAGAFATQASTMYNQLPREGRQSKPDFMRKTFLTNAVDQAAQSTRPLQAFQRMRRAVPESLQDAISMGWAPQPDKVTGGGFTEEQWAATRDDIIDELRAQQVKAAGPAFAARIGAAKGDMNSLLGVAADLAAMTGVAHPMELFENPDETFRPTGTSRFGTEYNAIYAKIAGPLRSAIKASTPDLGNNDFLINIVKTDYDSTVALQGKPKESSQYVHEPALNLPSKVDSVEGVVQLQGMIEQMYAVPNPNDPNGPPVLPAAANELYVTLDALATLDPPPSAAKIRGLAQAANIRMFSGALGSQAADGGLEFPVPQGTTAQLRAAFKGHTGGPISDPASAEYVANLYLSMQDDPDMLEEVFGKDRLSAEITAEQYEGFGGWNSDSMQVEDGEGQSIFASPMEMDRASAVNGWDILTPDGAEDTENPYEVSRKVMAAILLPSTDEGMDAMKALSTDGQTIAILGAASEDAGDMLKGMATTLGIDTDDNPDWINAVRDDFDEIAMEASLVVSAEASRDGSIATDNAKLGAAYRKAIKAGVARRFEGKAFIGGQTVDDPSGSLRLVTKQTKSNDPEKIWTGYRKATMASIMTQSGMTEVNDETMASSFYTMFPDFADDGVEASALMARAREVAQAGDGELNIGTMIKAAAELGPDGASFKSSSDDTMWTGARVSSSGDTLRWTFPNQTGGAEGISNLRFIPPVSLDTGRAVVGDGTKRADTDKERDQAVIRATRRGAK